jgi:hypothetical protein
MIFTIFFKEINLIKLFIFLAIFLSFSCSDLDVKDIKCETQDDCPSDSICVLQICKVPDEICVDGDCFPEMKTVYCNNNTPENSTSITERVILEYDAEKKEWPETPLCKWTCNDFYQKSTDFLTCEDINECLVNNGECGDEKDFSCFNHIGEAHTCAERRLSIFSTNTKTKGDFGGHAQADVICNNDNNRPDTTRKYKALLMDLVRTPDFDWPLEANTTYYRGDYTTIIGSTDENKKIIFDLENPVNPILNGNDEIWTGIYLNKDINTQEYSTDDNCNYWLYAKEDGLYYGSVGLDGVTNFQMIYRYEQTCERNLGFYCVEQY